MTEDRRPSWASFEEWQKSVPDELKSDALWTLKVYRLALFASDIGWYDTYRLDPQTDSLSALLTEIPFA